MDKGFDQELNAIVGRLRDNGIDPGLIAMLMPSLRDSAYNAEYERKGIAVGDNHPEYRPYCLSCSTMRRMEHRDYGYQCSVCGTKCAANEPPPLDTADAQGEGL